MLTRKKIEAGYTLLELLYVVSIISLLAALLIPQLLIQRTSAIEAVAQRRLRTIGSVMADYALTQNEGNYADFQELKDAHLINRNLTEDNLIVDYSLQVTATDLSAGSPSRYTIIAVPRPERSYGRLSTFAITEDNVVRVYKPGPGVDPDNPYTWQPIL
jgi:prepilin-type N-terminal cleavage/methylation domain-containing protein